MIHLEIAKDLLKEISVPVFIVNAPEALVVMALKKTVSRRGPELLILQEKQRNFLWIFTAGHGVNPHWQQHLSDGVRGELQQCRIQLSTLVWDG